MLLLLEFPCSIITTLKNKVVYENATATLRCKISKPRHVCWLKDEQMIVSNDRFTIQIDDGGLQHSLTISGVSETDSGNITLKVDDGINGFVSTTSQLSVKGKISTELEKAIFYYYRQFHRRNLYKCIISF